MNLPKIITYGETDVQYIKLEEYEKAMSAIKGFQYLLDKEILVRNTEHDGDFEKFTHQSSMLVSHLAANMSVLSKFEEAQK